MSTERKRVPSSLDCCPFRLMPYNEDSLEGQKVNLIWAFLIYHIVGILTILIATSLITIVAAFRCTHKNWSIWRVAAQLWWQTYLAVHISIECLDVTARQSRNTNNWWPLEWKKKSLRLQEIKCTKIQNTLKVKTI